MISCIIALLLYSSLFSDLISSSTTINVWATTIPDTTINRVTDGSGESVQNHGSTTSNYITFESSGTASFRGILLCSLDNAPFEHCIPNALVGAYSTDIRRGGISTSKSYPDPCVPNPTSEPCPAPLSFRTHTFRVVAVEISQGGEVYTDPSPATWTWTITLPGDSDGDGLLDSWEENGIDINGDRVIDLDLRALGADPLRKDIFVEVDYMQSHPPLQQGLADIRRAFDIAPVNEPHSTRPGINLVVNVDDEVVPHQDTTQFINDRTWPGFDAIKSRMFGTEDQRVDPNSANILDAKKDVYHYVLFIHARSNFPDSSGTSEIFGNDFVVSLGGNDRFEVDASGHRTGNVDQQEGTFMHELGHNLGLRHGGDGDENCKPNYLSVMSYSFQMSRGWIDANNRPLDSNRPLDYSRSILDELNENNLDELSGVSTSTPPGLNTIYGPSTPRMSQTGMSIDWNRDGDTKDRGVIADINSFGISCQSRLMALTIPPPPPPPPLRGFEDWTSLRYNFRDSPRFDEGIHGE